MANPQEGKPAHHTPQWRLKNSNNQRAPSPNFGEIQLENSRNLWNKFGYLVCWRAAGEDEILRQDITKK